MSQRPRILISQQQRLALNASLAASIRVLRSDAAGLTRYLEEQAAENPHLRLIPPPGPAPGDWLPRWSGVLRFGGGRDALPPTAETEAPAPSLIAHVTAAIAAMDLPPGPLAIALALTEALEPSGWLGRPMAELAAETAAPPAVIEAVLSRLQRIDPPGLFARGLAECLRLQAEDAGVLDPGMAVMLDNLGLLASGDLARLARLAGLTEAEVQARFRVVRTFNPKPGTAFRAGHALLPEAAAQREPDLVARALRDGRWQISLNRSALPDVEVVPLGQDQADADQLRAARQVVHMLKARNATLLRVAREIAGRQGAALARGRGALQPMTMAEVAGALDLHHSTVSRVIMGATLDTPHGLWLLRGLFSGARGPGAEPGAEGVQVSAAALRHQLAQLVAGENPDYPLTDQELSSQLAAASGVRLARRTIAKYREDQGIPPAHRRRRRKG